jgi:hypothetical protein
LQDFLRSPAGLLSGTPPSEFTPGIADFSLPKKNGVDSQCFGYVFLLNLQKNIVIYNLSFDVTSFLINSLFLAGPTLSGISLTDHTEHLIYISKEHLIKVQQHFNLMCLLSGHEDIAPKT